MTDSEEIKDFSTDDKPKRFRVGDDVFEAPAIIPPINLARFGELHPQLAGLDKSDVGGQVRLIGELFKILLPGPSGIRFAARLSADGSDPTTPPMHLQATVIPSMYWLLEQYGLRPTEQSSPSPVDAVTGDSTDGAPAEVLIGELLDQPQGS